MQDVGLQIGDFASLPKICYQGATLSDHISESAGGACDRDPVLFGSINKLNS